jgi:hypothetical protein
MNNNLLEWHRPSQILQNYNFLLRFTICHEWNVFLFQDFSWKELFSRFTIFHERNCFPALGFFMKAGLGMAAGATGAFVGTPAEVKLCNSRNTKRMLIFVSSGSLIKK